jgi:hypothetical protein
MIMDGTNGQISMNFLPTAAGGGNASRLGLSNLYNPRPMVVTSRDNTSSWTYTSATWRAANGNANNSVSYVDCMAEVMVDATYTVFGESATAGSASVGVNRDSTSATPAFSYILRRSFAGTSNQASMVAKGVFNGSLGYHTLNAVEASDGSDVFTFIGINPDVAAQVQGLVARLTN